DAAAAPEASGMVAAVAAASWLNCCCSRSHQACDADCAAWLTCSAVEAGSADAAAPPAGWLRDSGAAAPGCAGVAGFKPSATSSGDGLPPAAPLTNDRRVAMVARCTSSPWMVLVSMDRFMRSQLSTERSSAMRRSRSSRFMGGVMGNACASAPGPANPARAWRFLSLLARTGLPALWRAWPEPGRPQGLELDWGSDIQAPGRPDGR